MKPRSWRKYYGYDRAQSFSLRRKPYDRANPHLDCFQGRKPDLQPYEAEYCAWLARERGWSFEDTIEYAKCGNRGEKPEPVALRLAI